MKNRVRFILLLPLLLNSANAQVPGEPIITGVKANPSEIHRGNEPTHAPPNHAILSTTLDGWIFVPAPLKKEYDAAIKNLEVLQWRMDSGGLKANEAREEVARIKKELEQLRERIDASRVHIQGAQVSEQTETLEVELGAEKRVAITANQVRVIGWHEKHVKIELKKIVLTNDTSDDPEDHLKAMQIEHKHGRAEFAGRTDKEWEESESAYLKKDGSQLTDEQRVSRKAFVDSIRQSFIAHQEYVGKEIDQISVAGLDYQSNPLLTKKVSSEGGEGQWGSCRQRYAELTVYVPMCKSVTVRGARRGLQVEKVHADLIIVDEDSTDSDARGKFEVQGLHGNLLCRNFPLSLIQEVHGNVDIDSQLEFGIEGAGTVHQNDMRNLTPARPFEVKVHEVDGSVRLRFGRVKLDLREIQETIDCENLYGDIALIATAPFPASPHRIVSRSGRIDVNLSPAAWESIPVLAVTNYGGLHTNIEQHVFAEFQMQHRSHGNGPNCNWTGFRKTKKDDGPMAVFELTDRFPAILNGTDRSPGLDILTSNGHIAIIRQNP